MVWITKNIEWPSLLQENQESTKNFKVWKIPSKFCFRFEVELVGLQITVVKQIVELLDQLIIQIVCKELLANQGLKIDFSQSRESLRSDDWVDAFRKNSKNKSSAEKFI